MEVTIRKDKNDVWGLVETFSVYKALDKTVTTVLAVVTVDGKISTPYALRGTGFEPLKDVDEEMGLDRYLKAKKPIYSRLQDGFIVSIKAACTNEGEFIPDSVVYNLYKASEKPMLDGNQATLKLSRVFDVPVKVSELVKNIAEQVAVCKGKRDIYLKSRF